MLKYAVLADILFALLIVAANVRPFSYYDFEAIAAMPLVLVAAGILWCAYFAQMKAPIWQKGLSMIVTLPVHVFPAVFIFMLLGAPHRW